MEHPHVKAPYQFWDYTNADKVLFLLVKAYVYRYFRLGY